MCVAHFIGGPWHGEDRAITRTDDYIFGVEAEPYRFALANIEDPVEPRFDKFHYRRIGPIGVTVAGLTLYEYVEPTREVEIVIRKRVPKSKVEEERAELVRTLGLPSGGRLFYSGPARD